MTHELLIGAEYQRFRQLCDAAETIGYRISDTHKDSAARFLIRRAGRVVYVASDLDALADWLRG